jgi:hypothetical protein
MPENDDVQPVEGLPEIDSRESIESILHDADFWLQLACYLLQNDIGSIGVIETPGYRITSYRIDGPTPPSQQWLSGHAYNKQFGHLGRQKRASAAIASAVSFQKPFYHRLTISFGKSAYQAPLVVAFNLSSGKIDLKSVIAYSLKEKNMFRVARQPQPQTIDIVTITRELQIMNNYLDIAEKIEHEIRATSIPIQNPIKKNIPHATHDKTITLQHESSPEHLVIVGLWIHKEKNPTDSAEKTDIRWNIFDPSDLVQGQMVIPMHSLGQLGLLEQYNPVTVTHILDLIAAKLRKNLPSNLYLIEIIKAPDQ